jgi:hypothetical protein
MTIQVYPPVTAVSGDPASQTVPAIAAGTYNFTTTMAAGTYEITTDTVQSSFTLKLKSADGYEYSGTIRGGKGYIVAASPVTKMVVPSGLTYPLNINARLGASTLIAAPTGASLAFNGTGNLATVTWTAPAGATDIVAYWRDGSNTSMATTTSPKTNVAVNGAVHLQVGYVMLVAKDAFGNIGLGVEAVTSTPANIPISATGATLTNFTDGSTSYVVLTFTGSGTLNVNAVTNIDYLLIAGGGAGSCGGAGAGGYLTGTATSAATGSFVVTVGAGGPGRTGVRSSSNIYQGTIGSNSSIAFGTPISATGGGGGGMVTQVNAAYCSQQAGGNGGSGGGGGSNYNSGGSSAGGTGVSGQGNAGGAGASDLGPGWGVGGGGGGAGAVGGNRSGDNGGNGGNGTSSSINGTATTRAGGGGGGRARSGTPGTAGTGGGAAGSLTNVGISGTINTGGGAGGVSGLPEPGYGLNGSGGSGIVIVRAVL